MKVNSENSLDLVKNRELWVEKLFGAICFIRYGRGYVYVKEPLHGRYGRSSYGIDQILRNRFIEPTLKYLCTDEEIIIVGRFSLHAGLFCFGGQQRGFAEVDACGLFY